ncbi:MAG TPA: ABC transporter ATP-binding protein [Limnochordia bacterium]|nr:ABC transporter ATP-binding protein [Limnochordia bacterium]
MSAELRAVGLTYRAEERPLLEGVEFSARSGEWIALLGANGAGKSTLLRLLAGLWRPSAGRVLLDGDQVHALGPRLRARRIAWLPQQNRGAEAFTVWELVAMARYAQRPAWARMSAQDRSAVARALAQTASEHLVERRFAELSGGEQRRVLLARTLAQEAGVLLLDEPTAALDMGYQIELLQLVSAAVRQGALVVAALHEPDLAARFAQRILLLREGRLIADGPPRAVLTAENIQAAYDLEAQVVDEPATGGLHVVPIARRIHKIGSGNGPNPADC